MVKGLILVVAGGIALLAPQVSLPIVRLASAVALIVWGLTEVWTATRYWRDVGVGGLLLALISIATGVGILLVAPGLEILLILSGTYLFVRGVVVAIHLILRRNGQIVERTISVLLQITLGIMLIFAGRSGNGSVRICGADGSFRRCDFSLLRVSSRARSSRSKCGDLGRDL